MGRCSTNGVMDVTTYDAGGTASDTFTTQHALWTTRKGDGSTGSQEWLKQAYVAESKQGLTTLLSDEPLDAELPDGTSGCSSDVTVSMEKNGATQKLTNQHVILEGDPIPNNPKFSTVTKMHVSPVPIVEGHPLYDLWKKNID